jgi:hypothetical protein
LSIEARTDASSSTTDMTRGVDKDAPPGREGASENPPPQLEDGPPPDNFEHFAPQTALVY